MPGRPWESRPCDPRSDQAVHRKPRHQRRGRNVHRLDEPALHHRRYEVAPGQESAHARPLVARRMEEITGLARIDRLALHECDLILVGMFEAEVDVGLGRAPQHVFGPRRFLRHLLQALRELLECLAAQRLVDLLLALEIKVEAGLGEAGMLGELARADSLVAFGHEQLLGGVQDLAEPLVTLAAGLAAGQRIADAFDLPLGFHCRRHVSLAPVASTHWTRPAPGSTHAVPKRWPISRKVLNSIALPDGSFSIIRASSRASRSKRTSGSTKNRTPLPRSPSATCSNSCHSRMRPKWRVPNMSPSTARPWTSPPSPPPP